MHINSFDQYQENESPVHNLDPRVKVIIGFLFIVSTALLPDGAWLAYMLSWALVIMGVFWANIQPWFVIKRSLLVLPFLLAALTVIFTLPGNVLWYGPMSLTITDNGLVRFTSILLRSWISVQMAVLLTAATRFPAILLALRQLHLPAILVSILAFMYRYLFILADEVSRLLRARTARSALLAGQKGGRTLWWRAGIAGNMVGQLFMRSIERSDRVYQAMLARGYRGELLSLKSPQMRLRDWYTFALLLVCLLIIQLIGRLV